MKSIKYLGPILIFCVLFLFSGCTIELNINNQGEENSSSAISHQDVNSVSQNEDSSTNSQVNEEELVPLPEHNKDLFAENQNPEEPAIMIAPTGEDNLWIWCQSKSNDTLGTLISTPVSPEVIDWPNDISAGGSTPLWYAETSFYKKDNVFLICAAALNSEYSVSIFLSTDMGETWSEHSYDLSFNASGAKNFIYAFGIYGFSVFVTEGNGRAAVGFVKSEEGWLELSTVYPEQKETGATFTGAGMVSEKLGFVCCGYKLTAEPTVYLTNNGGESWFRADLPLPDGFDHVGGYIVGNSAEYNGQALILHMNWIIDGQSQPIEYESFDEGSTWNLS